MTEYEIHKLIEQQEAEAKQRIWEKVKKALNLTEEQPTMTRKQAAKELHAIQSNYEVKPLSLATVYRKIYKTGKTWHLNGKAHDYTV